MSNPKHYLPFNKPKENFAACVATQWGNQNYYNKQGQYHRLDGPAFISADGSKHYYINGKRSRLHGLPAVERPKGDKEWWVDGVKKYSIDFEGTKIYYDEKERIHRNDGPAVEWASGAKYYYKKDKLHREDGPAVELPNGTKQWWINHRPHREDGPAVENADGTKEWWLNGIRQPEPVEKPTPMVWSDEFYEFVVTPRWKLKKGLEKYVQEPCVHCHGTGQSQSEFDLSGLYPEKCNWCFGKGKQERLKPYPAPPPMNQKFLDDLKKFVQNYGKEGN